MLMLHWRPQQAVMRSLASELADRLCDKGCLETDGLVPPCVLELSPVAAERIV